MCERVFLLMPHSVIFFFCACVCVCVCLSQIECFCKWTVCLYTHRSEREFRTAVLPAPLCATKKKRKRMCMKAKWCTSI